MTDIFKKLNSDQLCEQAKILVQKETEATMQVLHALKEISRRRVYAEKSYPSLFEFCVSYLGYKRDAAYRRIQAMKLLKENPEIESKIQTGSVSLTSIAQAQTYFDQKARAKEVLKPEEKKEILSVIENKSSREVEKLFLELSPVEVPKEKVRPVNEDMDVLTIALPKRVKEKLEKLKSLMAPEKSGVETIEVIEQALDAGIRHYGKKAVKSLSRSSLRAPGKRQGENSISPINNLSSRSDPPKNITLNIKRQIWLRDNGQCTYRDRATKIRCTAIHRLEVDHIEAKAFGGDNNISNLRLVCRAHNQFYAIKQLGEKKMSQWLT